ncbi:MAG TPA: metallophosphoesterase [Gemmatimonadales bacterium]|nr:metallophosphoesterase [Gemmatimonadales bacterium]
MTDAILHDHGGDGIDRRGFLKCMAWAGTGALWAVHGGVLRSVALGNAGVPAELLTGELVFAQISDSHIGFAKAANPDVTATLQEAVDRLNRSARPAFVLHTGDITQLSKPAEFDTADEVIRGIRTDRVFHVPGEHDVLGDEGKAYLARYGRRTQGNGWYSFDHAGVHFVGLVNVLNLKAGGLGNLGAEQLAWLRRDLAGRSASTPIVLFAHVPLWSVYPDWGWGTDDSEQALALVRRFGSVTVLNGHIHQVMQKVEGNVHFHTAMSTAFPQPAPGTAPSPGPLTVAPGRLRSLLGLSHVTYHQGHHSLAIVDHALATAAPGAAAGGTVATSASSASGAHAATPAVVGDAKVVRIDNFSFTPPELRLRAGEKVLWVNGDDVPHVIASADGRFPSSQPLDTDEHYTLTLARPGTYPYYCSIHPKMTGRIVVQ